MNERLHDRFQINSTFRVAEKFFLLHEYSQNWTLFYRLRNSHPEIKLLYEKNKNKTKFKNKKLVDSAVKAVLSSCE